MAIGEMTRSSYELMWIFNFVQLTPQPSKNGKEESDYYRSYEEYDSDLEYDSDEDYVEKLKPRIYIGDLFKDLQKLRVIDKVKASVAAVYERRAERLQQVRARKDDDDDETLGN